MLKGQQRPQLLICYRFKYLVIFASRYIFHEWWKTFDCEREKTIIVGLVSSQCNVSYIQLLQYVKKLTKNEKTLFPAVHRRVMQWISTMRCTTETKFHISSTAATNTSYRHGAMCLSVRCGHSLTSKAGTELWNGLLTGGADTMERLLVLAAHAESKAESNGSNGWVSVGRTPDELAINGRLALTAWMVAAAAWRPAAVGSTTRTGVELKLDGWRSLVVTGLLWCTVASAVVTHGLVWPESRNSADPLTIRCGRCVVGFPPTFGAAANGSIWLAVEFSQYSASETCPADAVTDASPAGESTGGCTGAADHGLWRCGDIVAAATCGLPSGWNCWPGTTATTSHHLSKTCTLL